MVKGQGGNKSGAFSVLVTLCMMQQCVHTEASQLFCEKAVKARVEDGGTREEWHDNEGRSLRADRWWNTSGSQDNSDAHGPCMGIRVNIRGRAKASGIWCIIWRDEA